MKTQSRRLQHRAGGMQASVRLGCCVALVCAIASCSYHFALLGRCFGSDEARGAASAAPRAWSGVFAACTWSAALFVEYALRAVLLAALLLVAARALFVACCLALEAEKRMERGDRGPPLLACDLAAPCSPASVPPRLALQIAPSPHDDLEAAIAMVVGNPGPRQAKAARTRLAGGRGRRAHQGTLLR